MSVEPHSQWRREGGEGEHPPRVALCRGRHLEGQKYGILKFFTVHTNAIVVSIRITIGDLIAGMGAAMKMFAPGGKHPNAATADSPWATCYFNASY